jgi:hypothetical protein
LVSRSPVFCFNNSRILNSLHNCIYINILSVWAIIIIDSWADLSTYCDTCVCELAQVCGSIANGWYVYHNVRKRSHYGVVVSYTTFLPYDPCSNLPLAFIIELIQTGDTNKVKYLLHNNLCQSAKCVRVQSCGLWIFVVHIWFVWQHSDEDS